MASTVISNGTVATITNNNNIATTNVAPELTEDTIRRILREHYNIGELVKCKRNNNGFVNQASEIEVDTSTCDASQRSLVAQQQLQPPSKVPRSATIRKLFFRQYKLGVTVDELLFEHSLIRHLTERPQRSMKDSIADVLLTRNGNTFVQESLASVVGTAAVVNGNKEATTTSSTPASTAATTNAAATTTTSATAPPSVYYAVFEFLLGHDKYTWINPECTEEEIKSSAQMMARFHEAAFDHRALGQRGEPCTRELLVQVKHNIATVLDAVKDGDSRVDDKSVQAQFIARLRHARVRVENNLDNILKQLHSNTLKKQTATPSSPSAAAAAAVATTTTTTVAFDYVNDLQEQTIHCDFHPGNLKFATDAERVVGLFDFDWSKRDKRVFDVALALWYFFARWPQLDSERSNVDSQAAGMKLHLTAAFLQSYQSAALDLERQVAMSSKSQDKRGQFRALNEAELLLLPYFVAAANLYILNWTLADFERKRSSTVTDDYLVYLDHSLDFIDWLDSHNGYHAILDIAVKQIIQH
jgi:homoserine kinase type II